MWIGDYRRGHALYHDVDENFDALLTALILKADSVNALRLRSAFPEACEEVGRRYNSPGGAVSLAEWLATYGADHDERAPVLIQNHFEGQGT